MNKATSYPKHNIDPQKKGREFILQYAKAMWIDSENNIPNTIFWRNSLNYEKIRLYAQGKQPIDKYKKLLDAEDADKSYLNIDWSVRPIVNKFRNIAINKLLQREFNITATPIDPLAKDQAEEYFADIKAKILMKEALASMGSELAESPEFKPEPGEPEDLEELQMQMEYGYKHNMAIEAEMGINWLLYINDIVESRRQMLSYEFDFGVAGYKDWMEDDGSIKFRAVNPMNVVTSYCRKGDFSDMIHCGEVIEPSIADLSEKFSDAELQVIAEHSKGQYGNPKDFPQATLLNKGYDDFKVRVLDFEFISYNTKVYEQSENKAGNLMFNRTSFDKKNKSKKVLIKGKEVDKYISKETNGVYKGKWVIGTDFIYDFGLAKNLKRSKPSGGTTSLSYHFYAPNFYEMSAVGVMDSLIPILDEYQMTIYKIQSFKNKWLPYIIDIDLDALESVALGKGGENMKPMQLLDMMFQTMVLVGRRKDISGQNINYKAVDVRTTGMAAEFQVLVQDLQRLMQEMRDITGLNELTDGSTPNSKTLIPVAQMAYESTNNAIYQIIHADKMLLERLGKALIQRLQVAVKLGKVEGILKALGSNTVKWFELNPDIQLHEYGIIIEDRPTDQERQLLMERLNMKDAQGLVDPEDYFMIMHSTNLKQAEQLLAYRVRKRKEAQAKEARMLQQENGQIQMQSAQAAEQAKQATLQLEYQLKMQLEDKKGEWQLKIAELKADSAEVQSSVASATKIATSGQAVEPEDPFAV
jgi:hypothetical protein